MRVKCPNSEIYLELPGDRTDMKFNCPACHKVHRVTISITTPSDESARQASAPRAPGRNTAQMPKKYATGAYAPVVDIPIDANFVLLDGTVSPDSVDLSAGVPDQQTATHESARLSASNAAPSEHTPPPETPPAQEAPQPTRSRTEYESDRLQSPWTQEHQPVRRGAGAKVLLFLAAAVAACAAFFGWQHYRYSVARQNTLDQLAQADKLWQDGNIDNAAVSATEAEKELDRAQTYISFDALAAKTGLAQDTDTFVSDSKNRIRQHTERAARLQAFRSRLSMYTGFDQTFMQTILDCRQNDTPLASAMEAATAETSLQWLRNKAERLSPEEALDLADEEGRATAEALSASALSGYETGLKEFIAEQTQLLALAARQELAEIATDANAGIDGVLTRYRALCDKLRARNDSSQPTELADTNIHDTVWQLEDLRNLLDEAKATAYSILSLQDTSENPFDAIREKAGTLSEPNPAVTIEATRIIDEAENKAEDLFRLRSEVFGRIQSEMRRGRTYPGTRLAWHMLRCGFDDPQMLIDPDTFRFETSRADMDFTYRGISGSMNMTENDYENKVRITIGGFAFSGGWVNLFHKPLVWAANLATEMKRAGIDPTEMPAWELLEGPQGPLALLQSAAATGTATGSLIDGGKRYVFYLGNLLPVTELEKPTGADTAAEDFLTAARKLHDGIMEDDAIPQRLRQALKPVLLGTFTRPDPRDYYDSAFCRRLIEADYLESTVVPLGERHKTALAEFRSTLEKLEAGYDEFRVDLPDGSILYAISRLEDGIEGGAASDQDFESGETLPRLNWRIRRADETVYVSPLPARSIYAFMLAEHYRGADVPRGDHPELTEVWHATQGLVASYHHGDDRAIGSAAKWGDAVTDDSNSRVEPTDGPPGWSFPLHVIERDAQGDPLMLATLNGAVPSPDFSGIRNEADRRRAEDAWLDHAAQALPEPGELGLIFHQFFRYCSDSPLPDIPNLIGSHFGLSDTHQTVYQTLERRWVGRLIGDCDDLAEFFQVLTRKQGKLSHVMQLPSHAACGYVDHVGSQYIFVVLQTGPVMQFAAPTLNDAVETAYRSFDREGGMSHMTIDAVPLLLRFANEETRTPFVLSARIYGDPEYAETMIRVQSYWHENVYSAAIKVMEQMVDEDPEIGSIKELGSLYERVGLYDKAVEMRRRELETVRDNPSAAISTLLEIAQLYIQSKDTAMALAALEDMEAIMNDFIQKDDAQEFFRVMTFRSLWAMYLSRLGQPTRAWDLIRYDVSMTKRQLGRIAEPVLRTLAAMYDRICESRDRGERLSREQEKAVTEIRKELEEAFGRGYFKTDDSYNTIIARYSLLGHYAVSDSGRAAGITRLLQDGPYPDGPKDHTRRSMGIGQEDWNWFRISPQLFLQLGQEMLDPDDYPELYDPAAAKPLLEDIARAVEKGRGLGSDIAGEDLRIRGEMTLAFINRDLDAFRRSMAEVLEKNYSNLYDDTAMTFGLQCGMLPLNEFSGWIEAFHDYFPGTQHYFKVVYRAIDKENYDHALLMAEATARFFPNNRLLLEEAEFIRTLIPQLKQQKEKRDASRPAA